MLLPSMVCSAWLLVVGVQGGATGYASRKRDPDSASKQLPKLVRHIPTAVCTALGS